MTWQDDQKKVATGVTDNSKEREALQLSYDALGAYLAATDEDEDAAAHHLMAKAFFALKELLENK